MARRAKQHTQAFTVAELAAALEQIAPQHLAAEWDNVGLLAGATDWPAARVLLTIDLTDAVADEALANGADVIVAYHPPIFKGVRRITTAAEAPTRRLPELLRAGISVFALHTALDAAPGGTNDALLDAFDLHARRPLQVLTQGRNYKLVVFVPAAEAADLRAALARAGAGVIGAYDHCSFELDGRGTFRGNDGSNPTIGRRGVLEAVRETRLEMVAPRARIGEIVRALYAAHSYEEPAFDLLPLEEITGRGAAGMGRIGALRRATRGTVLCDQLAQVVDLRNARAVGDLRRRFTHVAAAAGAFGVAQFRDPATLYLTGEFKHHDALDVLRRGVTAIALEHWASERPILEVVRRRLISALPGLKVALARSDRAPFQPL